MSEMIGFIGLGNMGQAMASNLLKAGYTLVVYNRTLSKAKALTAKGARLAHQPGEAVPKGGIVITMVANDQALEEIVMSRSFLENLGPGGIHLSMSTVCSTLGWHGKGNPLSEPIVHQIVEVGQKSRTVNVGASYLSSGYIAFLYLRMAATSVSISSKVL
jgi:hypothetical protein